MIAQSVKGQDRDDSAIEVTGFSGSDALIGRLLGLAFLVVGTTVACDSLSLVWLDGGNSEAWSSGILAGLVPRYGGSSFESSRR